MSLVLEGRHVRLEPPSHAHSPDLAMVALDPELWRWTTVQIHSVDDLNAYIDGIIALRASGAAIPFIAIDRATGRAIGGTRFANMDVQNRRVEIGWTWYGRPYQRRAFNTEAKLLMLNHAFERMNCIRVEFRVNAFNIKSREAVARIGAREEGTLRHHMILPDGRLIDWVYYSILREEWPGVRAGLEEKLASYDRG
jgi:N-acetyltransferase